MTQPKTNVARTLALAAVVGSVGACAEPEGLEKPSDDVAYGDPVEAAIANLGTAVSGCANIVTVNAAASAPIPVNTTTSAALAATYPLYLSVTDVPLVLSAPSNVITANGIACTRSIVNGAATSTAVPLKTTDITQINITGNADDNKVILDFLPGSFGTKIFGTAGAGIKIDLSEPTPSNGTYTDDKDSVMFRASAMAETYRFAAKGATDVYVELTGDKYADVDIVRNLSATAKLALITSMGGGTDNVYGTAPLVTEIERFSGDTGSPLPAAPTLSALPADLGLVAYGGPGDDKFNGGLGDDQFFGGDGNDTFRMSAVSDGADVYSGDDDNDTVEYTDRTGPLSVDLGPERPGVEGGADLRERSLYVPSPGNTLPNASILTGKALSLVVDGVRVVVPFTGAAHPTDPADLVSIINTAINTAIPPGGATPKVYASLTAKNHLAINSNTVASPQRTSMVKVEDSIAFAALPAQGVGAETVLGLTGSVTTSLTGSVDLTTAALYSSTPSATALEGSRLVLRLSGAYVVVNFAGVTAAADVLAAINTAANQALSTGSVVNATLGTTGVAYASLNTSNQLVITAPQIEVLDGTLGVTVPTVAATTPPPAGCLLGFCSVLESTSDITALALVGKTLDVSIDGARVVTTFPAASSPADPLVDIVAPINSAANTALGTMGVNYASYVPKTKHLVLTSRKDTGGIHGVYPLANPALALITPSATATAAEGPLGIANGKGSKLVGIDLSNPALYTAAATPGSVAAGRLDLTINGHRFRVDLTDATRTTSTGPALIVGLINTAANAALGTTGVTYASVTPKKNKLQLSAGWIVVNPGLLGSEVYTAGNAANALLFSQFVSPTNTDAFDADDGLADEHDDVRFSTENIVGGKSNDILIGNRLKNTIRGGDGNDIIAGGSAGTTMTCTATGASGFALADADSLSGDNGNDTFLVPTFNCKASLSGGAGDNTVDFSGRTAKVMLKNNGSADDGEFTEMPTMSSTPTLTQSSQENVNIATDIKTLIGGFGNDLIVGGAMDDILVGGPGADRLTGGGGNDTADYSGAPGPVDVSLCLTTMESQCPVGLIATTANNVTTYAAPAAPNTSPGDDGLPGPTGVTSGNTPVPPAQIGEGDQVYQVEHLIGSSFDDRLSQGPAKTAMPAITFMAVPLVLEGGPGDDTLTGGDATDDLWGDDGDDELHGGKGADDLNGGNGDDFLDGGDGDADLCLGAPSPQPPAPANKLTTIACELPPS